MADAQCGAETRSRFGWRKQVVFRRSLDRVDRAASQRTRELDESIPNALHSLSVGRLFS
jgi:hypothetical protein